MQDPKPLFSHDCDVCTYLGTVNGEDLYHCGTGDPDRDTVIARSSSEGPDYASGLIFADRVPALGEAKRRAQALGLLP